MKTTDPDWHLRRSVMEDDDLVGRQTLTYIVLSTSRCFCCCLTWLSSLQKTGLLSIVPPLANDGPKTLATLAHFACSGKDRGC